MKRFLALLTVMLLVLTGCGGTPVSSVSSTPPDTSATQSTLPSDGQEVILSPQLPEPGWQDAYLAVLETLFADYGRHALSDDGLPVSGVKYARLLDFNADGIRELVVLFDRTVRLYTCRQSEAMLLYEGSIGARYGQTDVSYTFCINAFADTPVLSLFHSENEWSQEAITMIHLTAEGQAIQTELTASTDGANEVPNRESLLLFTINGQEVAQTVYESVRSAALDDAVEIDVDYGTFPATPDQLDLLLNYLEHWDAEQFILPDADTLFLTEADMTRLTARELRLARNEIYARHGRDFSSADLRAYFSGRDWYAGIYSAAEYDPIATQTLNRYEVANLSLILAVESSGNYNQNAPDLTTAEVLEIAEAYWNTRDGQIDGDTGQMVTISVDDPIEAGGRHYYICRLHCLVEGDRWTTRDLVYIDAQSGTTTSSLAE